MTSLQEDPIFKRLTGLPLASSLNWLRRANVMVAVAGLVACGVLGTVAFTGSVQAKRADSQRKLAVDRLKKANAALAMVKQAPPQSDSEGSDAVELFQEAVNDAAGKHSCSVNDLHASSDSSQFVSRYSKVTDDKGWNQTEVSVSLDGKLADVISTLAEVTATRVPLELDTVSVSRVNVDGKGNATVNAKVDLRVLTPAKEPQA